MKSKLALGIFEYGRISGIKNMRLTEGASVRSLNKLEIITILLSYNEKLIFMLNNVTLNALKAKWSRMDRI